MLAAVMVALVAAGAPPSATPAAIWFNSPAIASAIGVEGVAGWALPEDGQRVLGALYKEGLRGEALLADPRLAASVVLACLPDDVVLHVVPTDHYFYFEIVLGADHVAGNLRFSNAADGTLHVGLYSRSEARSTSYRLLSDADGICVHVEASDALAHRVRVVDERIGVERSFIVGNTTRPRPVLAGDVPIASVVDESGYVFALLYNANACAFRYELEATPREFAHEVTGDLRVDRSGFVFVRYPHGAWVLAGVDAAAVGANTFFDGPFDQVPPDVEIASYLREVYPMAEYLAGDSIDAYGVWESMRGVRVAVSPYREWSDSAELLSIVRAADLDMARLPFGEAAVLWRSQPSGSIRDDYDALRLRALFTERGRMFPADHQVRTSLTISSP